MEYKVRPLDYEAQVKAYADLLAKMNPEDIDFARCLKASEKWHKENPGQTRPITKTRFWYSVIGNSKSFCDPRSYLYANPPVAEASASDRMLIVGSSSQVKQIDKVLAKLREYQNETKALREILPNLIDFAPNRQLTFSNLPSVSGLNSKFSYVSNVADFWDEFFGTEKFIDDSKNTSVPCGILTTGEMREYSDFGGTTCDFSPRLEQIAANWKIPIRFIK